MKKSKILILLFTLSFPVIIYLFLRSYGQNEFDLPIFFENQERIYCKESKISSEDLQLIDLNREDSVKLPEIYKVDYKVIHFPNAKDSEIQKLKNELNRILNTFGNLSVNILSFQAIEAAKTGNEEFLPASRANTYLYKEDQKDFFINCVYAFPTVEWDGKHPSEETVDIDKTLVLLDEKNRIRGYYNGYETKEVDRLILEIRVLLSKK